MIEIHSFTVNRSHVHLENRNEQSFLLLSEKYRFYSRNMYVADIGTLQYVHACRVQMPSCQASIISESIDRLPQPFI